LLDASYAYSSSDTRPPASSPLSLHDALPISSRRPVDVAETDDGRFRGVGGNRGGVPGLGAAVVPDGAGGAPPPGSLRPRGTGRRDRKSTRLNSSHDHISYAIVCLEKKTNGLA